MLITNHLADPAMSDHEESCVLAEKPECPYCGHIELDDAEIDFGGCEGDVVNSCNSCGRDYHLSRQVSFYYTSARLKKDEALDGQ